MVTNGVGPGREEGGVTVTGRALRMRPVEMWTRMSDVTTGAGDESDTCDRAPHAEMSIGLLTVARSGM